MDEKKRYSLEDILGEDELHRHSARDISQKASAEAERLLEQLRGDSHRSVGQNSEFDSFMEELNLRAKKRAVTTPEVKEPVEEAVSFEPEEKTEALTPEAKEEEISVSAEPEVKENETSAFSELSDLPQINKKRRSVDEILEEIEGKASANKIERALAVEKDEKPGSDEQKLTRTGAIRKADALLFGKDPEEIAPAVSVDGAGRMGYPHANEKIVGEKDDIQTKAYNAYIRTREKKKQDTGIIKTIDIKLADKKSGANSFADERTRAVPGVKVSSSGKPLVDEETDIEKTIFAVGEKRVISQFHHTGNIEGQTRLEGFFDDDEVEKISEDELEQQLEINRRKKIDNFEFEKEYKDKSSDAVTVPTFSSLDETYAPEKETPVINDVIDYNSKNDKRAIYIELEQLLNRFKIRTGLTFAAFIVSAVIGIFASGIITDFGLGTGNEKIYIIINTAILLFMILVNARAIIKGLKALFVLKPSADSLPAVAALITLAHCIASFFFSESGAGINHLYVGAAGVVFLLNCIGKRSMMRRIFKNFRFIIKGGEKYTRAIISDEKEIKEFVKGAEQETYNISYNAKTEFPTRFLANSFADDPSDIVAKYVTYPVIGISFLIAVISYFISKDMMSAVSTLCAVLLVGVPASSIMAFNKALENSDNTLLKERGTISGFAAADDVAETNAVVIDSSELFPEGFCSLKGMKLYKRMQMDEAILYAASVLEGTNHPLKNVFMESVSEVKDKMPASFDTAYESRLGLSSWIYDRKVLLGTKEMMGAHGIEIPDNAKPEEYIRDNSRVMFLAIDGAVYAMFVVEYFSEPDIEFELQRLEASSVELLVKTVDANIDEALLSELFEIDIESTRILSGIAGEIYEEKVSKPVYNEAQIVGRGDTLTFLRSLIACSVLSGQFRLLKTLNFAAVIIGIIVVSVLAVLNSISTIGPVHIGVYMAFWMVITNIIPRIYKAVPKR